MNTQEIIDRLDRLYWIDMQGYIEYLNKIKQVGYKVYRNNKGQHKVESIFGSIFDQILNGGK